MKRRHARCTYIREREAVGENMSVRETGLTLCPTMSYIGASADGYVTCHSVDTCCCGALAMNQLCTLHPTRLRNALVTSFVWSKERMACYT